MPNNAIEWGFWIFSTIVVGLIIGIGVNLITPRVKDTGEGWFQKRRLKQEKYRKNVEALSRNYDKDPMEVLLMYLAVFVPLGTALAYVGFSLLGSLSFITLYFLVFEHEISRSEIIVVCLGLLWLILLGAIVLFRWMRNMRSLGDLSRVHADRKRAERIAAKEAQTLEVENDQEEMIDSTQ